MAIPSVAVRVWTRPLIINLIALVALLAGFGLAFWQVLASEGGSTRQQLTIPGAIPTPVIHFTPTTRQGDAIAIIVHGNLATKEVMIGFGIALAKMGVPSYLLDLPGFGASSVELSPSEQIQTTQFDTALDEVVHYARAHSDVPQPKIVLLGHSLGAYVVGTYALSQPASALAATILISGGVFTMPTTNLPANMLLLIGQHDVSGTLLNDQRLFLAACGGGELSQYQARDARASTACGQMAQGTGRRLIVIPGAYHITIISDTATFQLVDDWVAATDGIPTVTVASNARFMWLLIGALCAVLALFPLIGVGTELVQRAGRSPAEPRPTNIPANIHRDEGHGGVLVAKRAAPAWARSVGGRFALLAAAIVGTLLFLRGWALAANALGVPSLHTPLTWIQMVYADDIGSYWLVLTLELLGLTQWMLGRIAWPTWREIWPQVVLGVAIFMAMYLTLGVLVSYAFLHLLLDGTRLLRFVPLLVASVLLFALLEGLFASEIQRGFWRSLAVHLGMFLLLGVGLALALVEDIGQDLLELMAPIIVIMLLFCIALAQRTTRRETPLGLARAMVMAASLVWAIAALFPLFQ